MKKSRQAKKFLEELRKTPIVSAVCSNLHLSRQSVYRWLKEDPEFKKDYDECMLQGVSNINDLAISQLINKIKQGDAAMVKYWLSHNHENYMKKQQEVPINDPLFNNPEERRIDFLEAGEAMLMKKVKQGDLNAIRFALQYNSGRYHPMKAEAPFLDMTDLSDPSVVATIKAQMDFISERLQEINSEFPNNDN